MARPAERPVAVETTGAWSEGIHGLLAEDGHMVEGVRVQELTPRKPAPRAMSKFSRETPGMRVEPLTLQVFGLMRGFVQKWSNQGATRALLPVLNVFPYVRTQFS